MSMLSAQCDELREVADEVSKLEYTDKVSVPWMRNKLAPMLRTAADTIWELRCRLADMVDMRERARLAEAENAKLVEIIDSMLTDYLCCADTCHLLYHVTHKGKHSVYRPAGGTLLERISETRDGIKIRDYLDTMKEMGHEL